MRFATWWNLLSGFLACGLGIACGARSTIDPDTGGETDETHSCLPDAAVACFSGPPEARGVGACRDGERRCDASESDVCVGEVLPSAEDCGAPGNESCDGDEHVCSGTVGWALSFGDGDHQYMHAVTVDGAGDIVVAGSFGGTVELAGDLLEASEPWLDVLVMKVSPDGAVQWARSFGTGAPEYAHSVTTDAQLNVYLAGTCSDYAAEGPLVFGSGTIECEQYDTGSDGFVAKLSPEGEPMWIQKLGQTSDHGGAIRMAPDGSLVVLARSQLASSDIAKLDTSGAELWRVEVQGVVHNLEVGPGGSITVAGDMLTGMFVETMGPSGELVNRLEYPGVHWLGQQLAVDPSGDLFLAAAAESEVQLAAQTVQPGDLFAIKVSPDGQERWAHVIETAPTGFKHWTAFSLDALGNPLLAGRWTETIDPGLGLLTTADEDAFLVKLRGDDGSPLWQTSFGSVPEADSANAIASDGAHTHYVVGGFTSYALTLGGATLQNATQDGWAWDGFVFQISE